MRIFKTTEWKWWELKIISWGGVFLGFALGFYLGDYLASWIWLVWTLCAILWLYVLIVSIKKLR